MDRTELLNRVRDDAERIASLANGGTNIPLDQYVDKISLGALCDSLTLDPDAWQAEDLERVLIIRDGLYGLRNRLRDLDDDAEHSVEQLLSAFDRLYADLERALREFNQETLRQAQNDIAALQRSPHISATAVPVTADQMRQQAGEVLVTSHITVRNIEFNLLKIDRSSVNFELLRNTKLSVQRLSASVFAIKVSLEQSIIYQGIFKLLSDGADHVLEELKKLLQQVKASYDTAAQFITDLGTLADKGTRFVRLVTEFLGKAFAQSDATEEIVVNLKVQVVHQGDAIVAAAFEDNNHVALAGKSATAWSIDLASNRFSPRYRLSERPVFCLAHLDNEGLVVGTDEGAELDDMRSRVRERITAIAVAPWGEGAIITGSRDGVVRRLTLAGGLTQLSEQSYEQVGRKVACLAVHDQEVVAASGSQLVFLNNQMRTTRTMRVPFDPLSMAVVAPGTLVICGEGNIAHVNTESGAYSRIMTASNDAMYCCVAPYDLQGFYFGTSKGRVGVMSFASGEEYGSVDVGFELRGILPVKNRVLAYGGDWKTRGRCAALLVMEATKRPISASAQGIRTAV